MSADDGDHHPLFSLGAVGRVHTGQASRPATIHPPLLRTRQPVSVQMAPLFNVGGGTGIHSLDDG